MIVFVLFYVLNFTVAATELARLNGVQMRPQRVVLHGSEIYGILIQPIVFIV